MDSCVGVYGIARCNSEVGKVVFEFSEEEDLLDINLVVNRKRLVAALQEVGNFMRKIDKGYLNNMLMVKGREVIGKTGCTVDVNEALGSEYYIKDEEVYDELGKILGKVSDLMKDCD